MRTVNNLGMKLEFALLVAWTNIAKRMLSFVLLYSHVHAREGKAEREQTPRTYGVRNHERPREPKGQDEKGHEWVV